LAVLPPSSGVDYVRVFVRYVIATQETKVVRAFGEAIQRHSAGSGGEVMTYAQELLQEGERKGKIKGQIEIIENLLKAGMEWALIESATGIDQNQLQALKQQLEEMRS
jgi:predicted transposase/invertase (TIGR01784 family)